MMSEELEPKAQQSEEDRHKLVQLMKQVSRRGSLLRVVDGKTGAILASREAASLLTTLLNTTPEMKRRERLVAAIALRYVPIAAGEESATAQALGSALQINDLSSVEMKMVQGWLCFLAVLAELLFGAVIFNQTKFLVFAPLLFVIGSFLFFAGLIWLAPRLTRYRAERNADVQLGAAETLSLLQLPDSIGALAKASRGTERLADVTRQTLTQLLPMLTIDHYGRLPNDATPELCALLFDGDISEHLITLTLEALGKMGDGRGVEPLAKFAQTAKTPKLREMAKSLLPILEARREQENASSTLLRHSSAPPVAASQLLRAASVSAATPPEFLLRPSAETGTPPTGEA